MTNDIKLPLKPYQHGKRARRRRPGPSRHAIHRKYGRLLVLGVTDQSVTDGRHGYYLCRCDCGNIVDVQAYRLLHGHTVSCGCAKDDLKGKPLREIRNKWLRKGW